MLLITLTLMISNGIHSVPVQSRTSETSVSKPLVACRDIPFNVNTDNYNNKRCT